MPSDLVILCELGYFPQTLFWFGTAVHLSDVAHGPLGCTSDDRHIFLDRVLNREGLNSAADQIRYIFP